MLASVLKFSGKFGSRLERPLYVRGKQINPLRLDAVYWGRHDPALRQGLVFGFLIHALLILAFLLPWFSHMEQAYGLPKGSGTPTIGTPEKILVRQKPKPKKKFTINPASPILFNFPKMDDTQVADAVQQETLNTYQATGGKGGKLGKGGGTKGGWPEGMDGAKVRFIRLEYAGGNWDHNMGNDADYNVLIQFHELTGFPVAGDTEHIAIEQLRHFPKNHAPPFIFITGSGGMVLTPAERKTIRWYCMDEGGMILADNGGGAFDSSFRNEMHQIFPELGLADIPSDDIIYQQPYIFPNGAPPLFHASGFRPEGLRFNDRWICFYHPGEMGDCWRTGHSGIADALALESYKLGVNIINYAFNQYTDLHPAK